MVFEKTITGSYGSNSLSPNGEVSKSSLESLQEKEKINKRRTSLDIKNNLQLRA